MTYDRVVLSYTLGLGVRTLLMAGLTFLALWLVVEPQLYATALVVGAIALAVIIDVGRKVVSADRLLARFVDTLATEGDERPTVRAAGLPRLAAAMERALDRVRDIRLLRQQRIDYLESLCDTVPAALVVIDHNGDVEAVNRAARSLLPALRRLSDLGDDLASRLNEAQLGAGQIVRLKDGRAMFAMVTGFSAVGARRRLLSLQRVAGDLDAVELRAWSELVRVLSHEIMNSLTPICSLAQSSRALLTDDGQASEAFEVIGRRSAGLMTFVERYRAVFDVPVPDRRRVALGEILARTEALMASQMADASVAFTSNCDCPRVQLDIDPLLMDQAIINLLKNALDAVRGRSDASVSLTARIEDDLALIEVTDNGEGVPAEDVEAVFVPFFTRKPGGSGVGLSIVRQIASAHGGVVEYLPAAGGGAMFRLGMQPAS